MYSWKKVVGIVGGSVFFCSLLPCLIVLFLQTRTETKPLAILQKTHSSFELPPLFFAESLGLTSYGIYDAKRSQQHLEKLPMFKKVHVKQLKPHVLLIEYELREPIALLGEYTNTGIDAEGKCFPLIPFYSPQKLPEVYWGAKQEHWERVMDLLELFKEQHLKRIDVTWAGEKSLGRQEMVVFEGDDILRLGVKDYKDGVSRYFRLRHEIFEQGKGYLVDLRTPQVAFFEVL